MAIYSLFLLVALIAESYGSHFEGGSISWKIPQSGPQTEVYFEWAMGWYYQKGPCGATCSSASVGSLGTASLGDWICSTGCSSALNLAPVVYTVTGVNSAESWEQGTAVFSHDFGASGVYEVSFEGYNWRSLNFGTAGPWALRTTIDSGIRSDMALPNLSPKSTSSPIYRLQHGCPPVSINIPMIDADGDVAKCRWALGKECESVCQVLPDSTLHNNGSSCLITIDTSTSNYAPGGWYAVALQVDDFPSEDVMLDTRTYTVVDAMSSIPVQFLVYTPSIPVPCNAIPEWISPTPANNHLFMVPKGGSSSITFHAKPSAITGANITDISVNGPAGALVSALVDDPSKPGAKSVSWSWTPNSMQTGGYNLCFLASDTNGKSSDYRCVALVIAVECADPGIPTTPPGIIRTPPGSQNFFFRDVVTFQCPVGHEMTDGSLKRKCQMSGNFDAKNPTCERVHCPVPQNITLAHYVGTDYQYGGVVRYYCDVGYEVKNGTQNRTCQADRTWSGDLPTCGRVICQFKPRQYAHIIKSTYGTNIVPSNTTWVYEDFLKWECDAGYLMTAGTRIQVCQATGKFNGTRPTCEEVDECMSTPCNNGGMCVDHVNAYSCKCVNGYHGPVCNSWSPTTTTTVAPGGQNNSGTSGGGSGGSGGTGGGSGGSGGTGGGSGGSGGTGGGSGGTGTINGIQIPNGSVIQTAGGSVLPGAAVVGGGAFNPNLLPGSCVKNSVGLYMLALPVLVMWRHF